MEYKEWLEGSLTKVWANLIRSKKWFWFQDLKNSKKYNMRRIITSKIYRNITKKVNKGTSTKFKKSKRKLNNYKNVKAKLSESLKSNSKRINCILKKLSLS